MMETNGQNQMVNATSGQNTPNMAAMDQGMVINATPAPVSATPSLAMMNAHGPHPTGPPNTGPHATGPHTTGPHSSGPPGVLPQQTMGMGPENILERRRIADLVKEVDPMEQLDEDVEELLMEVADDFIDNVATAACLLAKHRKSQTLDVKDVQLHLERNWNMWIPGFGGSDDVRPYRKAPTTDAHKQRLALIKKNLKKY